MNKTTVVIYNSLPKREFDLLYSLYCHRCLKATQIYEFFYKTNKTSSNAYCVKRLSYLVNNRIIEKKLFEGESIYFLTSIGVEFVRIKFLLPSNVYDEKKNVVKRGYFRASELKLSYKNIRHQLHLNEFVLGLKPSLDVPYTYFDEKHLVYYRNIRPDGLISTLDVDFFLEMDMGTETIVQLKQKWINYRNFLSTNDFIFKEKKIVMLFIVDGIAVVDQRINLIKKTLIDEMGDCFKDGFEVLVGTMDEMKKTIVTYINDLELKRTAANYFRSFNFAISDANKYSKKLAGYDFDLVAAHSSGSIFLVDIFEHQRMSVLSKILFYNQINSYFKQVFQKEFRYLIVCSDEKELLSHSRVIGLNISNNVYYTTYHKLSSTPIFYECLYQADSIGNVFTFKDDALMNRVFERTIVY